MFDLDAAIRSWRDSFGESMRAEDLNELEEHLRAQVTALSSGELTEKEAFLVAHSRMGRNGELASEFAKVHAASVWIRRIQWMVLGFLGINALVAALRVVAELTGWSASVFGLGSVSTVGVQAVVQILGLFALVWIFFGVVRARLSEGRRLVLLSLVLALATPLLMLGRGVVMIGQSRMLGPEEMGYIHLYRSYAATAAAILLPLALFLVVYVLERKRRTA